MAKYKSTRTYDGQEVEVFADEFESGPGMVYQPTNIWAMLSGKEFALTEAQRDEISITTTDAAYYDDFDA